MLRPYLLPAVFLLATTVGTADAQRSAVVSVSAKVDGKTYDATGAGSCRHSPTAAIHNVPAALWLVQHTGSGRGAIKRLNLTFWRPKDGSPERFSLAVKSRSSSHRIDVGGRGKPVGSGKAALSLKGTGGRFEIKGKDDSGTPIEVTIKCPAFGGIEAEGG